MDDKLKMITGFVLGAAAGIVAGWLTAPRSGEQTRKKFQGEADRWMKDFKEKSEDWMEKAKGSYNELLHDLAETDRKIIDKTEEKLKAK